MVIEGRRIYLARGAKSLSVNICEMDNRRGDYEWIVRVFRPQDVTEAEIRAWSSIADLIGWLTDAKNGDIEKEPPPSVDADPGIAHEPPPEEDRIWIEQAVTIVEESLDQLVSEFLRAPYLHRVEHSLHARLFAMLFAQPHLNCELPLSNRRTLTQPIHKEWPETVPSPETRRGNFDLAILSPALLAGSSVEAFRRGNIPAPIVIELGLDYGAAHLGQDAEKLIQSRVQHGYLVQFTRRATSEKETKLVLDPGGATKVAFACTAEPGRFKRVNGDRIETR
ncbi:MAG: hypothetical protein ACLQIB_02690 [Isosphaeraceae bacterium]